MLAVYLGETMDCVAHCCCRDVVQEPQAFDATSGLLTRGFMGTPLLPQGTLGEEELSKDLRVLLFLDPAELFES